MSPLSSDRDRHESDLPRMTPHPEAPDVTDSIFEEICLEEISLDHGKPPSVAPELVRDEGVNSAGPPLTPDDAQQEPRNDGIDPEPDQVSGPDPEYREAAGTGSIGAEDAAPADSIAPCPEVQQSIRVEGSELDSVSASGTITIEGLDAEAAHSPQAGARTPAAHDAGSKVPGQAVILPAEEVIRIEGLDPERNLVDEPIRVDGLDTTRGPDIAEGVQASETPERLESTSNTSEQEMIHIEGLDLESDVSSLEVAQDSLDRGSNSGIAIDWSAEPSAPQSADVAKQAPAPASKVSPACVPAPKPSADSTTALQEEKSAPAKPSTPEPAAPCLASPTVTESAQMPVPALTPAAASGPAAAPGADEEPKRKPDLLPHITPGFPASVDDVPAWVKNMARHPFAALRRLKDVNPDIDYDQIDQEFELMYKAGGEWDFRAFFARYLRRPDAEAGASWTASLRVEILYALLLLFTLFGTYIMTEMLR